MKQPPALWILLLWLLFLAFGGLYGGITMLLDPTGKLLQADQLLPLLPVPNFILPGLFLLFMMGLAPLVLIYALLVRPRWGWLDAFFRWSGHHWAWTGTLILCAVLACWLTVQALMIGFTAPIQFVIAVTGVLILLFALLPAVRKYYRM